jgi:hypothetical protein
MSPETEIQLPGEDAPTIEKAGSTAMRVITWFSVGVAVATVGIFIGAELRSRSKFKKRTPYDFYANAGEQQASEFGVGV